MIEAKRITDERHVRRGSPARLARSQQVTKLRARRGDARAAAANVLDVAARHDDHRCPGLEHDVVLALATGDDLTSAMAQVVESVCRSSGATSVEWWTTGDDGHPRLGAATGIARGRRQDLPLASASALVLHGGSLTPELEAALTAMAPIIRRRMAEERLAGMAVTLARRNQALEDFAALVAHELKTPLHAALLAEDPSELVRAALDVVDALLEAASGEVTEQALVSAVESVDRAVQDVGGAIDVTTDLQATVPLPPETLRVLLRNLLANAISAGARHVHVAAVHSSRSRRLFVDDDGVGLAGADRYATGSGLGLSLSQRMVGRYGGVLELVPNPAGGTRALLEFPEGSR